MSGYFSELAHHTGLSLERGASKDANNFPAEPSAGVQLPDRAPTEPLHVEEISFTAAPAPDAAKDNSERLGTLSDRDGVGPSTREVHLPEQTKSKDLYQLHGTVLMSKGMTDSSPGIAWEESPVGFTGSAGASSNLREPSPVENFPASGPVVSRADEKSAERQSLPQESLSIPYDSIEIVESRSIIRDRQAQLHPAARQGANDAGEPEPTGNPERDAIHDEDVERTTTVHNYLKEVRAWVSAPPEPDRQELEWQRDAERLPAPHRAERPLASHNDAVDLEREIQPAHGRAARSETLEVQDLNLSIGTISIIIEEPKQIAPTAHQPSVRVDSSRERPASEPTRLSRYYLGRW
jgi:hypothetical protein